MNEGRTTLNTTTTTTTTTTTGTTGTTTNFRIGSFAPLPPRPAPLPQLFVDRVWNAAALLGIDLPTSHGAVKRARREMARCHHPDVGGSVETMQQINAAADFLLELCR